MDSRDQRWWMKRGRTGKRCSYSCTIDLSLALLVAAIADRDLDLDPLVSGWGASRLQLT
jgi:hypothetical protein